MVINNHICTITQYDVCSWYHIARAYITSIIASHKAVRMCIRITDTRMHTDQLHWRGTESKSVECQRPLRTLQRVSSIKQELTLSSMSRLRLEYILSLTCVFIDLHWITQFIVLSRIVAPPRSGIITLATIEINFVKKNSEIVLQAIKRPCGQPSCKTYCASTNTIVHLGLT